MARIVQRTDSERQDAIAREAASRPIEVIVRRQDVDAAEAIESHFAACGDPAVELMVKSDLAAATVRRLLQRQIDAELATQKAK